MKKTLLPLTLASLCVAFFGAQCSKNTNQGAQAPVLRFSAIPDQDTTAQAQRYRPAAQWLSQQLGIPVEFVPSAKYADSIDKFKVGDIDLAWFGGVSGVHARNAVKNSKALVAGKRDLAFSSYFIANASTGLTRSKDFPTSIAGKSFTFGSSGSTSGCIMPTSFILKNTGKTPKELFSKVGFSGAHDITANQVQDGTFEVGALNYTTYDRLVKEGKIDPAICQVIWKTPPFADYNFSARGDLDKKFGKGFTQKLQKVLIECKEPSVLKAFDRKEFVKVTNATFSDVEEVMNKVTL